MRLKFLRPRFLFALLGAFTGMTICWIIWGLVTPGDFFSNGNPGVLPTVLGSGGVGAYVAFKTRSRVFRVALVIAAVLCFVFWVTVPDGWWASAPPMHVGLYIDKSRTIPGSANNWF